MNTSQQRMPHRPRIRDKCVRPTMVFAGIVVVLCSAISTHTAGAQDDLHWAPAVRTPTHRILVDTRSIRKLDAAVVEALTQERYERVQEDSATLSLEEARQLNWATVWRKYYFTRRSLLMRFDCRGHRIAFVETSFLGPDGSVVHAYSSKNADYLPAVPNSVGASVLEVVCLLAGVG